MASLWELWSFFENCVAAACAPAMAEMRVDDFSFSVALDSGNRAKIDPGFKEKGLRGFGSGNFIGSGLSTGARPLTAASYICVGVVTQCHKLVQSSHACVTKRKALVLCSIFTFLSKL